MNIEINKIEWIRFQKTSSLAEVPLGFGLGALAGTFTCIKLKLISTSSSGPFVMTFIKRGTMRLGNVLLGTAIGGGLGALAATAIKGSGHSYNFKEMSEEEVQEVLMKRCRQARAPNYY